VNPPVAFLDASVLYPAGTRDLLMRLAVHRLFHARWSKDVHREWMAAVRRDYPDIADHKLERTRSLMDEHAEGSIVADYEFLIDRLELPDPGDRHVLAAAITGKASRIVTGNLRHFPAEFLRPHGISAEHPDVFILRLVEREPARVVLAVREHRSSLRNPAFRTEDYLAALHRQGLTRTVAALRGFAEQL